MYLQTAFFAFPNAGSDAKELNQTIGAVRDRFNGSGQRIINVETVEPKTFLGLQLKPGGLRVWYEATTAQDQLES